MPPGSRQQQQPEMSPKTIIIPLPPFDYDPSEVSVVWKHLTSLGHKVVFGTPDGQVSSPDPLMLTGVGLDLWSPLPLLSSFPLVGLFLRANGAARSAHAAMVESLEYKSPSPWSSLEALDGDALFCPGGHKKEGMVPYLESSVLQSLVVAFFRQDKIVASICHGSLLVARSIDERTGKSVLFGKKVTGLTWALEQSAWTMGRIFRFWDPNVSVVFSLSLSLSLSLVDVLFACSCFSFSNTARVAVLSHLPRAPRSSIRLHECPE